jgi:hypothetical protein
VQDLENHCFEDFVYGCLGHVAIGVRVGGKEPPPPEFDFAFLGRPVLVPVGTQGGANPPGVVLADLDAELAPYEMDGSQGAGSYIPSRDGTRVLWTNGDLKSGNVSMETGDVSIFPPLAFREVLAPSTFIGSLPHYGWLGDQDRVYHERYGLAPQSIVDREIAAVPGGGGAIASLTTRPSWFYLEDVRISPGKTMILLRWSEYSKGAITHVDVLDALTGAPVGLDLPTSTDPYNGLGPDATPRWLPPDGTGESPGIYFIEDDGYTVTRLDPDGSDPATLYTMTVLNSYLVDFVVATPFPPDPPECAFVRRDYGVQAEGTLGGGPDFYCTDDLAGGDYGELDLGGPFNVIEMVPLYSDTFGTSLVLVQFEDAYFLRSLGVSVVPVPPDDLTFVFTGGGGSDGTSLWTTIPAPLSQIDVSNNPGFGGQFLVWVDQVPASDADPLDYPVPGIYHLDGFAGNPTLVTPPGLEVFGPPRWLRSWRFSPGWLSDYFSSYDNRVR